MIRSLIPFTQLTRAGIPAFEVCRMPLLIDGEEIEVGQVLPATVADRSRIRQLYEQRRIQPVVPPVGSKQAAVARQNAAQARTHAQAHTATSIAEPESPEEPLFPSVSVDVPVLDDDPIPQSQSQSYQPSRSQSVRRKGVR